MKMRIVLQGGDNMLGRAIQLTLPYQTPGDENITDSQTAQDYLDDILPHPDIATIRELNRDGSYLWGDLPFDLQEDVRIINLEAAPTLSIYNSDIPNKSIHYHVNIQNLPGLFSRFTRPYVLGLANNHSMDMGRAAFISETLPLLSSTVGIGVNSISAHSPQVIGNIAIFAFGAECAGVPPDWQATPTTPGKAYLPPIVNETNVNLAFQIIHSASQSVKDECIVVSIHWGPNWAQQNDGQIFRKMLAHRLIDEAGVDIIHGHSSHHIRGIEIYKGKLILYGAGDFVNDYEQIPSDYNSAGALYVIDLDSVSHNVDALQLIPFEMRNLRCTIIADPVQIKSVIGFINTQSIRDSENALIL